MNYYQKSKETIRQVAIDWQKSFESCLYSMEEVVEWQIKFRKLGKRYGLLTEFKENGIL